MSELLHEILFRTSGLTPTSEALKAGQRSVSYESLATSVRGFANALAALGVDRRARVAVLLEKTVENVVAMFGASAAGCVFVPVNPLLKPEQVAYILRDCNTKVLVTSSSRARTLLPVLGECKDLAHLILVGDASDAAKSSGIAVHQFETLVADVPNCQWHRVIDIDMAAILYTSGSTGNPKGVVISHRNLVVGAHSVSNYLQNSAEDRILAVLPLSFDYGLSQLTTGFLSGASVVLHNYLLANDLVRTLARERITGLAAVPPLWMQLCAVEWPSSINEHLRYFTNSGGAMPTATLKALSSRVPRAKPYLMYGLTEAFRSTYLPPEEAERRPTSIGKAIPNAEILVLREDGSVCADNEPGELVHRGALVAMGYWNDPARTAERFKVLKHEETGVVLPEMAVWSGDTVIRDPEGYLYFVSRRDEMIKTSGYRVSPTEVEEVVYRTGLVVEAAVFGVPHETMGESILLVAKARGDEAGDTEALLAACRDQLPAYMMPTEVVWHAGGLPRNPNGKIDRKALSERYRQPS